MEPSARLTEQLSRLAHGTARDGAGLLGDLTALVSTLTEAVSGYAGLRLTIVHTAHPVRLTALQPRGGGAQVVTSLRLSLTSVSTAFEEGAQLVVWSSVPGSLVDLAADLGYVLRQRDPAASDRSPGVDLDVDLPLPETASGVEGLEELATIHRASGLLIEQGEDPASVQDALRGQADRHGLTTHAWAGRLLQAAERTAGGRASR